LTSDDEILRELRAIRATLRLAFAPQLDDALQKIQADEISAAILEHAEEWVASGALQQTVSKQTKRTDRAVRGRFGSLIAQGVLEARGAGRTLEYRRTGLL
jgi:hypothetical protein